MHLIQCAMKHKVVRKLWGWEFWILNEPEYCAKILKIMPGFQCSLHYHNIKKETFAVIHGIVKLEVPNATIQLGSGDHYTLDPGRAHRFSSGPDGATILEVSTHHDDADVVRLEESRAI